MKKINAIITIALICLISTTAFAGLVKVTAPKYSMSMSVDTELAEKFDYKTVIAAAQKAGWDITQGETTNEMHVVISGDKLEITPIIICESDTSLRSDNGTFTAPITKEGGIEKAFRIVYRRLSVKAAFFPLCK